MAVVSDRTLFSSGLFFIAITLVLSVGSLGTGGYLAYINFKFASHDVERVFAVVDQVDEHYGRYGLSYKILFHYSIQHENFYAGSHAVKETGDGLRKGGLVPVKYLINSPQTCRIDLPAEDSDLERTSGVFLFLGILLGLVCTAIVGIHRRSNFGKRA